jgi:hypothetical protein
MDPVAERIRPFIVQIPRLTASRAVDIHRIRALVLQPLADAIKSLPASTDRIVDVDLTAELVYWMATSFMHERVLARRPISPAEQAATIRACIRAAGIGRLDSPR